LIKHVTDNLLVTPDCFIGQFLFPDQELGKETQNDLVIIISQPMSIFVYFSQTMSIFTTNALIIRASIFLVEMTGF